ncbi:21929_t:CDS:10, partial [Cetraspora pellucida]
MTSNKYSTYFSETPAINYSFIGFYKYRSQQPDFSFSYQKESRKLASDLEELIKDDSKEIRMSARESSAFDSLTICVSSYIIRLGHKYLPYAHSYGGICVCPPYGLRSVDHRKKCPEVQIFWDEIESYSTNSKLQLDKIKTARTVIRGTRNLINSAISEIDSTLRTDKSSTHNYESNERKRSITSNIQAHIEDNVPVAKKQRGSGSENDKGQTDISTDENSEFSSTPLTNSTIDEADESVKINDIAKIEEQLKKVSRTEWRVGNINITQRFRQYQLSVVNKVKKGLLKWDDTYEILALASIIVLSSPCPYPYEYFTFNEWSLITETNPYKIEETIIPPSVSANLHEAAKKVVIGKNVFMNAEESSIGQTAARIFNELLDRSAAGSQKRPDFSCIVNNIPLLNSEIKPLGFTPLQKKKDFVKVNLRAKKSINQQLNLKGGPNKSVVFTNAGDVIESFIMDLSFDGIYSSWPFCKSRLVIDKASMPVIESTFCHFIALEAQTNKLAEDFISRRDPFTPPNQIMYGFTRENPDSPEIRR